MKAKVDLDDELLRTAQKYFRKADLNTILNQALKDLIHMQASRQLAALGGTMPDLKKIKRTRADELNSLRPCPIAYSLFFSLRPLASHSHRKERPLYPVDPIDPHRSSAAEKLIPGSDNHCGR